jgi:ubiquinone/menaquinone biosynthesis C-methylase UbiE
MRRTDRISGLERLLFQGLPQTHLLDVGCGAGCRIRDIPGAVGIDSSPEMLAAGGLHTVVAGDIREMPFVSGQFDMVWCRLVLGYLRHPFPAYRESSRVCMPVVTRSERTSILMPPSQDIANIQ